MGEYLLLLKFAYNNLTSSFTRQTLFFLIYGFHLRDTLIGPRRIEDIECPSIREDIYLFLKRWKEVRESV